MARNRARRRVVIDDVKFVEAAVLAKQERFHRLAGHVLVLRCSIRPTAYLSRGFQQTLRSPPDGSRIFLGVSVLQGIS
jgi:hypothetical protein